MKAKGATGYIQAEEQDIGQEVAAEALGRGVWSGVVLFVAVRMGKSTVTVGADGMGLP